ncbi:hypothetical protein [Kineosporia babensis]|uniref:Uncharacterized protein n=1 Tax=Kineosporia babensis TaxID=499548 RepID=A0A9X1NL09_9ACTN|nr:hypothetical protein [Kineosporia babensis]MCD5316907.1 hypothetical protein [Kineosporia babensis]
MDAIDAPAPRTWILHPAGEGDFGVDYFREDRTALLRSRHAAIRHSLAANDVRAVERALLEGRWKHLLRSDELCNEGRLPPLSKVLTALADSDWGRSPTTLVLVHAASEVTPETKDPASVVTTLDPSLMSEAGGLLADAFVKLGGVAGPIDSVLRVEALSTGEDNVVAAMTRHHPQFSPQLGDRLLVSWGSGATAVCMGLLTTAMKTELSTWVALAGLHIETSLLEFPRLREAGDHLLPFMLRWRLFSEIEKLLLAGDPVVSHLDAQQRQSIRRLAQLHEEGAQGATPAGLLSSVADALVRQDGTTVFGMRRYVEVRSEQMSRTAARGDAGGHADPLAWINENRHLCGVAEDSHFTLGARLGKLTSLQDQGSPALREVDTATLTWLLSDEVTSLNTIGKGGHELRAQGADDRDQVARWLPGEARDQGLPAAVEGIGPVGLVPAQRVLVAWPVGNRDIGRVPLSQKLMESGVPSQIRGFVGIDARDPVQVSVLLLHTSQSGGQAESQAARLLMRTDDEAPVTIDGTELLTVSLDADRSDPMAQAHCINEAMTAMEMTLGGPEQAGFAAVLVMPTGPKTLLFDLAIAAERFAAQRSLPLFVADLEARIPTGPDADRLPFGVHQWPILTGGNGTMLASAWHALQRLELDTAARILSASAHTELADQARELADEFAARREPDGSGDPSSQRAAAVRRLHERLQLVKEKAGEIPETAASRLVVLACSLIDIYKNKHPGKPVIRKAARPKADEGLWKLHARADFQALLTVEVLFTFRNTLPITHGSDPDLSQVLTGAIDALQEAARNYCTVPVQEFPRPQTFDELLGLVLEFIEGIAAVPSPLPTLSDRYRKLLAEIDSALGRSGRRTSDEG